MLTGGAGGGEGGVCFCFAGSNCQTAPALK